MLSVHTVVILKIYFEFTGGGDLAAMKGHQGLEHVVSVVGTEFIRYKIKTLTLTHVKENIKNNKLSKL